MTVTKNKKNKNLLPKVPLDGGKIWFGKHSFSAFLATFLSGVLYETWGEKSIFWKEKNPKFSYEYPCVMGLSPLPSPVN